MTRTEAIAGCSGNDPLEIQVGEHEVGQETEEAIFRDVERGCVRLRALQRDVGVIPSGPCLGCSSDFVP